MGEYCYEVMPYETDIFGFAPPSLLIKYSINASTRQAYAENLTDEALYRELGAVWMLARVKLWQEQTIRGGDTLAIGVTSQHKDGATLLRAIELKRDGASIAQVYASFIAVSFTDRKIIRPSAIAQLWPNAPIAHGKSLHRLTAPTEMPETGAVTVRHSDCDFNGHLNSAKYADIICDSCGFWQGGQKLLKSLQIDYSAEILPGREMRICSADSGGMSYMRGESDSGICFTAEYFMTDL